jgi:hypothetical protein
MATVPERPGLVFFLFSFAARDSARDPPPSPSFHHLFTTPDDRAFLVGLILHCADISNAVRPFPTLFSFRDAMDACKGLSPEEEAACMLQFGCDAGAVHARLDGEEAAEAAAAKKAGAEAGKAAAA